MGCLRIGVATPWDDCPYGKSNANTFVCARAYRVFPENPILTRLPQVLLQCRPSSFSVVIQLPFILSQVVVRALSCPELFSTPFLAASAISVYCSVIRVRRIECLPIFSSRQNTPLRTESGVACRGLYHARVTHAQSIQYMIQGCFSRKGCELRDKALQFGRPDWEVLMLPLYFV